MSIIPQIFKRFAVSGLYDHQPEPPNTIAVGSYDEVMRNLPGTPQRSDALQRAEEVMGRVEAAEAEQAITRAGQVAILNDMLDTFTRRVDAYVTRRDEQARLAAEEAEREEQRHIQAQLDALPDPDTPPEFLAQGELTMTPASEPQHEAELAAMDQGDLPNELVKEAPPEQGNTAVTSMKLPDPAASGYPQDPPEQAQPVAVSLNTEDD